MGAHSATAAVPSPARGAPGWLGGSGRPTHAPIGHGAAGGGWGLGATSPARVVGAGLEFRLGPSPRSRCEGRAQMMGAADWRALCKTGKKYFVKMQQMFWMIALLRV